MKLNSAKKQTVFLSCVNGIVRALGMSIRIFLSRTLGAEAMGVMELAQSLHMVVISPFTSGLPAAITRLTAKASPKNKHQFLYAGLWIVKKVSFILIPFLWLFSPVLARLMGDMRILPSIWFSSVCILILGYSAVYNGYSYGVDQCAIPAASELLEQFIRFVLISVSLRFCAYLTIPWLAAVPVLCTTIAEIGGLIYVIRKYQNIKQTVSLSRDTIYAVCRLSAPSTLIRMIQTLLRSLTAVIIPLRLQHSGLSSSEATALLGMLNGMVSPFLMLPGIFTSALSMVMLPRIAKAEEKPSEIRRLLTLCLLCTVPVSMLCALCLYLGAPWIASVIYHEPSISQLFRISALQLVLFPLNHLTATVLSALGQQRRSLYISVAGAVFTLSATWLGAGDSRLRIAGVIFAQYASLVFSILMNLLAVLLWRKEKRNHSRW